MIGPIIAEYLGGNHRRLVLPELGAFLKKEDSSIVFVPFLNKDDGELNSEITKRLGVSALEASEIIRRYKDELNESIAAKGSFLVKGVGTLKKDGNGIMSLDTESKAEERGHEAREAPTEEREACHEPQANIESREMSTPDTTALYETPVKNEAGKPAADVLFTKKEDVPAEEKRARKPDMILIIAIIIALGALAAILYGYSSEIPIFNLG